MKSGRIVEFKEVTKYNFYNGEVAIYDVSEVVGHVPAGAFETVFYQEKLNFVATV